MYMHTHTQELEGLLPTRPDEVEINEEEAEEVDMIESEGTRGVEGSGRRDAYDSDDDDDDGMGGGHRMGCSQQ